MPKTRGYDEELRLLYLRKDIEALIDEFHESTGMRVGEIGIPWIDMTTHGDKERKFIRGTVQIFIDD